MTMSPLDVDYDMNYLNEDTPPAPGMVKTIGANGKVEWKRLAASFAVYHCNQTQNINHRFPARYKQYTKDDILAAIEEVINTFLICNTNLNTFSNDFMTGKERNVSTASKSEIWGPLKDTL